MAIPAATSGEDLVRYSLRASTQDAQDKAVFVRLRKSAPASMTDYGQTGDEFADENWLYKCVAPNTWRRVALSTF
jgi:hypothetical protein